MQSDCKKSKLSLEKLEAREISGIGLVIVGQELDQKYWFSLITGNFLT